MFAPVACAHIFQGCLKWTQIGQFIVIFVFSPHSCRPTLSIEPYGFVKKVKKYVITFINIEIFFYFISNSNYFLIAIPIFRILFCEMSSDSSDEPPAKKRVDEVVKYKLSSAVGEVKEFEISKDAIRQSSGLQEMLAHVMVGTDEVVPVGLPAPLLEMIIMWCEQHKDDPPFEDEYPEIDDWNKRFLSVGNEELFEIIRAADMLLIHKLHHMACRKIAMKYRGYSHLDMGRILGLND